MLGASTVRRRRARRGAPGGGSGGEATRRAGASRRPRRKPRAARPHRRELGGPTARRRGSAGNRLCAQNFEADSWVASPAHLGLALACAATARLDDAEREALRGERLRRSPQPTVGHAHALLVLAQVRADRSRLAPAATDLKHARTMIAKFPDPGRLPAIAAAVEQDLTTARAGCRQWHLSSLPPRPSLPCCDASRPSLPTRDRGELYVSLNTVKPHTRDLYRKLGASSHPSRSLAPKRSACLSPVNHPGDPGPPGPKSRRHRVRDRVSPIPVAPDGLARAPGLRLSRPSTRPATQARVIPSSPTRSQGRACSTTEAIVSRSGRPRAHVNQRARLDQLNKGVCIGSAGQRPEHRASLRSALSRARGAADEMPVRQRKAGLRRPSRAGPSVRAGVPHQPADLHNVEAQIDDQVVRKSTAEIRETAAVRHPRASRRRRRRDEARFAEFRAGSAACRCASRKPSRRQRHAPWPRGACAAEPRAAASAGSA